MTEPSQPNFRAFARQWLAQGCQNADATVCFGVLLLTGSADGALSPAAVWPDGKAPDNIVMQAVESAVAGKKIQQVPHEVTVNGVSQARYVLAFPLLIDGVLHGVAALDLEHTSDDVLSNVRRDFAWHLHALEAVLRRAMGSSADRLNTVLNLVATALHHDNFQAASTAVMTELAGILKCERVSIGFVENAHAKVRALSHSASFGEKANLIRGIGACMDEAIDQQATVVFPPQANRSMQVTRYHAELLRTSGEGAVCSIPFASDNSIIGAITFEQPSGVEFDSDT